MSTPNICVLKADGINCDGEMAYAFEASGGNADIVHINQLRSGERKLDDFQGLAIPGGFSYGDDIASGKVLANELTTFLGDQLQTFVEKEKPILGVCNGFQVLVRSGLLPFATLGEQRATLADNDIGRFECRWIDLNVGRSACRFVNPEDFFETTMPVQTAHGEGKFFADQQVVDDLVSAGQVVFKYAKPTAHNAKGLFPHNPNGSQEDIAGVTNPSGTILGMMPHPERSFGAMHPHRARTPAAREAAARIFSSIVSYARHV